MSSPQNSLAAVIDEVNEAYFINRTLSKGDRLRLARHIAARQGQSHAYAATFALFEHEIKRGISLFTGDRATNASAKHIAGEEACRALRLLDVEDKQVAAALGRATENLLQCLARSENAQEAKAFGRNPGLFCCGRCTVGMWRHLTVGGLDRNEERLQRGLRVLPRFHLNGGRFSRFPFWYTDSALIEIDLPESRKELKRMSASLERAAAHSAGAEPYAARRRKMARRALELIA
jgi:hypothetical protein